MIKTSGKAVGLWLLMVAAAILNALFRENVLAPGLGESRALPMSGVFLSLFILAIVAVSIGVFGKLSRSGYFWLGGFWVGLSLIFEVGLGMVLQGKTFSEVVEVFNVFRGNLFVLVLLTTLLAPWIMAKLRKII